MVVVVVVVVVASGRGPWRAGQMSENDVTNTFFFLVGFSRFDDFFFMLLSSLWNRVSLRSDRGEPSIELPGTVQDSRNERTGR